MAISMKPVDSTQIKSLGYDKDLSVLYVEFSQGTVYRYYDVPETVYQGLLNAEHPGVYFNRYVKSGGYEYEKLPVYVYNEQLVQI